MKIERKRIKEEIAVVDAARAMQRVLIFTPLIETGPTTYHFKMGRGVYPRENIRMELSDKRPVNRIDDDTFQIVTTGEILKRVR